MAQLDLVTYMSEKQLTKLKLLCRETTDFNFVQKPKKAEKPALSRCRSLKFRFHEK
jgi:hypothetical protein